jgi:MFS family permease
MELGSRVIRSSEEEPNVEKKSALAGKEIWGIVLLALINLLLFADQNLMAPNLTQIARDLGLSDLERDVKLGGNISLVFFVLGGAITLVIGYLTDRLSRKRLFALVVLIGALPCFLTGLARNYDQLFWLRALTGIGIGGVIPLTYSLIGDYFKPGSRPLAVASVSVAQGLGIVVGQMVAGFVGPELGWRLPFMIVAAPNFVFVLVFFLSVREPMRGATEESLKELIESGQAYTGKIDWSQYREIFSIRTNVFAFLQGIPGCVPWGVFMIFLNDFFAQDKGMSVEMATLVVMAAGAATLAGNLGGGFIGQLLYKKRPRNIALLCAATTSLGVVPTALMINYPGQGAPLVPLFAISLLAGLLISVTGPNIYAMVLNVNAPETRGSIFSIFNLVDALGKGFGPVIISALIMGFGRQLAFNIANLFWLLCGLFLFLTVFTFEKDEARLKAKLEKKAREMRGES